MRRGAAIDERVERVAGGVRLHSPRGAETFDAVVMAGHSDQSLALLAQPHDAEAEVLSAIRYHANTAVLHTDERLLPRRRLADGRVVGLNVSCGVNETSFGENCFWIDGQLHRLGPVHFAYDRRDLRKHWRLSDGEGRLELEFTPEGSHREKVNAVILASNFEQMFGRWNGRLRTAGGDDFFGKLLEQFFAPCGDTQAYAFGCERFCNRTSDALACAKIVLAAGVDQPD